MAAAFSESGNTPRKPEQQSNSDDEHTRSLQEQRELHKKTNIYAETLLQHVENADAESYLPVTEVQKEIHTLRETLENGSSLYTASGELIPIHPESLKTAEAYLETKDKTTGAKKRMAQNDYLREKIIERKSDIKTLGTEVCMLNLDVRGLKAVNDATNSHEIGNDYLKNISKIMQEYILPVLKNFFEKKVIELHEQGVLEKPIEITNEHFSFSRDGGDEFSLIITIPGLNFDELVNTKDFFKENPEINSRITYTDLPLHAAIAEYVSNQYKDFDQSNILPNEVIDTFINREADGQGRIHIPEDFEFRSYMAVGSATLSEIVTYPEPEDCKHMNDEFRDGGMDAVNRILGMIRSRSDKRAYEHKEAMNKYFESSDNPSEHFMLAVISRNEFTLNLYRKLQERENSFKDLNRKLGAAYEQIQELQSALNECKEQNK